MINPNLFTIYYKKSLFYKFDENDYNTRSMKELITRIPNKAILDHLSKNVSDKLKLNVLTSQINVNYSIKALMNENIFIDQKRINKMYEDIQFMYEMACADSNHLSEISSIIKTTLYGLILLFERDMINFNIITELVNKYNNLLNNPLVENEDTKNINIIKDKITKIIYLYEHILRVSFKDRKFKDTIKIKCSRYSKYVANIINELYSDRKECIYILEIFRIHPLFIYNDIDKFNGITALFGIINTQILSVRLSPLEFEAYVLNFILKSKNLYVKIINMCEYYNNLHDRCLKLGYTQETMSDEVNNGIEKIISLIHSFIKYFVINDIIKLRDLSLKL